MARKQILLDLLQHANYADRAFFDGLTKEQKEQTGAVDDWAPKDVIAHVNYWKRLRVDDIKRVLEGGSVKRIEDFDHENAKIFETFSDQNWTEIMAFAEEATAALMGQLEKMSESDLEQEWRDEQPIWRVIFTNGYSHPLVHIAGHYQEQGDMRRAAEVTGMLGKPALELDDSPEWQGLICYNEACRHSLLGQKDDAIAELSKALSIRPNLVEWSQQDPDLDPIRNEPEYIALYE